MKFVFDESFKEETHRQGITRTDHIRHNYSNNYSKCVHECNSAVHSFLFIEYVGIAGPGLLVNKYADVNTQFVWVLCSVLFRIFIVLFVHVFIFIVASPIYICCHHLLLSVHPRCRAASKCHLAQASYV
jgi:hypothetical protein